MVASYDSSVTSLSWFCFSWIENLRTVVVQVWHLELLSCCWELGGEADNLLSSESSALLVHLVVKGLPFAVAKRKRNQTYSCLVLKQVSACWCCCLVTFVDLVMLLIAPLFWLHHCWNCSAMLVVSWFAVGILLSCFWTIPVRNHKKNITTVRNFSRLSEFAYIPPFTMKTFTGVSTPVKTHTILLSTIPHWRFWEAAVTYFKKNLETS